MLHVDPSSPLAISLNEVSNQKLRSFAIRSFWACRTRILRRAKSTKRMEKTVLLREIRTERRSSKVRRSENASARLLFLCLSLLHPHSFTMFHQRGLPEMLRPSPLVPRHNGPSNKHLALLVAWASRKSSVAMSTNYKKGRPSSTCALVIRTQGQIWAFYGTEKSKKRAKKRSVGNFR